MSTISKGLSLILIQDFAPEESARGTDGFRRRVAQINREYESLNKRRAKISVHYRRASSENKTSHTVRMAEIEYVNVPGQASNQITHKTQDSDERAIFTVRTIVITGKQAC